MLIGPEMFLIETSPVTMRASMRTVNIVDVQVFSIAAVRDSSGE